MEYEWKVRAKDGGDIVETLLKNRGVAAKDADVFLHPDWDRDTHDPFLFTRMQEAVDRVFIALEAGEKIVIHGDYDADGVSGSALLYTCLRDICEKMKTGGVAFDVDMISAYLPDREKDGYGVAEHTVKRLVNEGVKLLITVDCGIANASELAHAHEVAVDVIICDHHQLAETIPEHAMIIHPLAPGEIYPNKFLCGTGVAYKLASALISEARKREADFPEGYEKWYLDLVAIATVTDVMPLLGENRVIEKFGLQVLNKTRREGILQILENFRGELGSIDTTTIGYQIGPRLNAAGRISSAQKAFDTLVAGSRDEAFVLAGELEQLNKDRRKMSDKSFKEAKITVEENGSQIVNVLCSEEWKHGIVGLIAGKLVTRFGAPAFAITRVGSHYVGSGRSAGGLHLVEAMRSCGDIFIKAGGHPQACGLSLKSLKEVELFREGITRFAEEFFLKEAPVPTLDIDLNLRLQDLTWDLYADLARMEPFGEKNRQPLFVSSNLQVLSADRMGKTDKHFRLTVNPGDGPIWKMVGFSMGDWADDLSMGDVVDVVYEVSVNEWRGNRELQCIIKDIKKVL
jgi:single-stranded-DNA-specific exonuclease